MNNVYVLHIVDMVDSYARVIGIFAAQGLAEMARERLESEMTDSEQDSFFYRITAYELGKVY